MQNKPGSPPIEGEGLLLKKEWKSFFFFSEMHIKMLHTAAPLEMEKNIIRKFKMLKFMIVQGWVNFDLCLVFIGNGSVLTARA